MTHRILIADEGEARCYDIENRQALARTDLEFTPSVTLSDPIAHQHDRDLQSDRPGRAFCGPRRPNRRGATAHHGIGAEASPRARESALFARHIVEALSLSLAHAEFDELIVAASPHFLGLLREASPARLRTAVVQEIHKDLVHLPPAALRKHLAATLAAGAAVTASLVRELP